MRGDKELSAPTRWWDPLAALLLLLVLLAAANRLIATHWVADLSLIQTITTLGVLTGLLLGQSIFSPRMVVLLALVYGGFVIPWQLGLTIEDVALWSERLIQLAVRLLLTLRQLLGKEDVRDPLFFLFLMASLFWALSLHAGYTLTRHARPWHATLPAGITLLIIHLNDSLLTSRALFLAAYLFFVLMLLTRLLYLRHSVRWQRERFLLPPYLGLDVTRVALQFTALLVLVAWTMPALTSALSPMRDTWRQVTRPLDRMRELFDSAFASLSGNVGVSYNLYGQSLLLGAGSELTDELTLLVQVQPDPPMRPRYYWRARVYDQYLNNQWNTTAFTITRPLAPRKFDVDVPDIEGRWTAAFTVTTVAPISTLYIPPQPLWVDRLVEVDMAYNSDGTADMAVLQASPYVRAWERYRVRSSISTVTIAQLRAAGTDYPRWVTDRYLQLPDTITPRTRELARELALDRETPYDVVAAVTYYLRTHITYNEVVPNRRPTGQDPVDWFLFDLREGFCNYYASAQVVMLRSLGIPARLAVGFAQGEWQARDRSYVVRRRDAHAWPEVYFPTLGWIEFEPTSSQLPLNRPLGESEESASGGGADTPGGGRDPIGMDLEERLGRLLEMDESQFAEAGLAEAEVAPQRSPLIRIALPALALALVLLLGVLTWRVRRQRGYPPLLVNLETGIRRLGLRPPALLRERARRAALLPLPRAYMELNHALARLGLSPRPSDTPIERAAALVAILPEASEPIHHLLSEYHAAAYGPHPGDLQVAQQAGREIRLLSWQARIRRWFVQEQS